MRDDILEEVFAARQKILDQCDYDFQKMVERFRKLQERCSPELLVREKVPKSDLEEGLPASYNSPPYQAYEEDEIIAEVRAAREKIAAECGYDMKKLGERLVREQEKHPERLVTHVPPKTEPEPAKT
ncbi:MAG: hypothetical protein ABR915_03820 [Thermoguttaceae bacterium]|jgi:hypothetical protein